MRYVFFGSPDFAAIILKKLIEAGYLPTAVVCNPDEPAGRKKILTAPPVKQMIGNEKSEMKIKILQPENFSSLISYLSSLEADLFIVAAYGKIIPKEILEMPRLKAIGIHPSLLPKYRGPSPVQSAILNDEKQTGATVFLIDGKVDHGPILANGRWLMANGENYETLSRNLAELGADLLIKILPDYIAGKIKPQTQNEAEATFTKKFSTEDGKVDLKKDSAEMIVRKIRALNPDPGVFAFMKTSKGEIRLKILDAAINNDKLEFLKVQPEGKNPMTYKEFLAGHHLS